MRLRPLLLSGASVMVSGPPVLAVNLPVLGLPEVDASSSRRFSLPQSTTYRIPGMVMDVSATLVATTIRRVPGGRLCSVGRSGKVRGRIGRVKYVRYVI